MLMAMLALPVSAETMHVRYVTVTDDVITMIGDDVYLESGQTYSTQSAPSKSGYIFTGWSIDNNGEIASRDRLGRAREVATFSVSEKLSEDYTTVYANYVPESQDTDNDNIPDGWEVYWYGDLSKDGASDTDGDGLTFAEELAAGLDPLMPDETLAGGVAYADGTQLQYNPDGLQPYTIRCEPEGTLFATVSDYLAAGSSLPVPSVDAANTTFAFWRVNGVERRDRHGRAIEALSVTMPSDGAVEVVAVCEADANRRARLYWYGREVAMDEDTDGDGLTFAEELAAGLDPLMPDETLAGGIVLCDGILLEVDLRGGAASVPDGWFDEVVMLRSLGIDADEYRTRFIAKFGGDMEEALLKDTGKMNANGVSYKVWQEYVLGTDPLDEDDKFVAKLTIEDGVPKVTWEPELPPEQAARRKYTIHGKKTLDGDWNDVTGMDDDVRKDEGYRFFKVSVEMKPQN